ncbi:MAG TPA: DUF1636 family protein [Gemmobacter sp.]|nr:DUF1636 family protein [Gemmobacter sp.]
MTSVPRDFRASPVPMAPLATRMALRQCQDCPHRGGPCLPGLRLLQRLSQAVGQAAMGPEFEISGHLESESCGQACRLAWRATESGTWVFGDVAEGTDLDDLVQGAALLEHSVQGSLQGAAAVLVARAGALN